MGWCQMSNSAENIYLFENLRKHAYRSVYKFRDKPEEWEGYIYACANVINEDNDNKLPIKVVRAVAKSVIGHTYPNSQYDKSCSASFTKRQSDRGKLSGQARRKAAECKKITARLLKAEGYTIAAIVEELKVSKSSVYAWLKDK